MNDFGELVVIAGYCWTYVITRHFWPGFNGHGDRRFVMGLGGNCFGICWDTLPIPRNQRTSFHMQTSLVRPFPSWICRVCNIVLVMRPLLTTAGAGASFGKGVKNMTPEQIRGLQINQGFQPDVPCRTVIHYKAHQREESAHLMEVEHRASAITSICPTGGARPYLNWIWSLMSLA